MPSATSLRRTGHPRAVIANGDGDVPDQPDDLRRDAVNALMGGRRRRAGGAASSPSLLEPHEGAPFGVRYDDAAVVDAFRDGLGARRGGARRGFRPRARRTRSASTATAEQATTELDRALRRTDDLVGSLLDAGRPRATTRSWW